jgi:diguanylate cyclase (GGDEF)-like protein/PAS domain S-box-containing protein
MTIRVMIVVIAVLHIASQFLMIPVVFFLSVVLIRFSLKKLSDSLCFLRESARIFNASATGICLIDSRFKIRRANDSLLQLLETNRNSFLGQDCYRVLRSDKCLSSGCSLIRIMSGESSFETEEHRQTRSGASLTWNISISPLYNRGKLIGIVKTVKDITERKRLEEKLAHTATHDPLTDLPNRALFYDRVSQAIARTKRTGKILAVLFIDLDRFKEINDSLGHYAGDQVLQIIAGRVKSILRDTDTVARLGGDEFLVLVNEISIPENTMEIVQKIMETLRQPLSVSGRTLRIDASIGLAVYPDDGEDGWSLIRHADIAMYRAKKSAGIKFQRYTKPAKAAERRPDGNPPEPILFQADIHDKRTGPRNIKRNDNTGSSQDMNNRVVLSGYDGGYGRGDHKTD